MRGPVREREEERTILVGLDHPDCLLGEIVCQVTIRLKRLDLVAPCRVKGHGETHRRPQEAIDRIEVLPGINHIGVVFR